MELKKKIYKNNSNLNNKNMYILILIFLQIISTLAQNTSNSKPTKYSTYSKYFENHIDIIVISLLGFVIVYSFVNSLNFTKKKTITYNTRTNHYNIQINRPLYISILTLLLSYSQFISILSLLNINRIEYSNLYNISKKLDWLNLWNINILQINNSECTQLNFFFQNHFIYIIGLVCITIGNIILVFFFNLFYKIKIVYNNQNDLENNITTLGFTCKKSKKRNINNLEIQDNSIIQTRSNYKNFKIITKNNYTIFPYMQLLWTQFAFLGLIASEFIMFRKNCSKFIIISLGAFVILPTLYITYIIATIYNKIKCKEDLIYSTEFQQNKNKSFIALFNKGIWFSQAKIKFCKGHSPIYVDFIRKNIHYNIFNYIKIIILAIVITQDNTKDINIILYIISLLYIVDITLIFIMRPFKNIMITIMHLITNISSATSLLLMLYTNNDIYTMFLIDYTFIFLIISMIIEFVTYNIYTIINH